MPDNLLEILSKAGAIPSSTKLILLFCLLPPLLIVLERLFPAWPNQHVPRRSFVLNLSYWCFNPLFIQVVSKLAVCAALLVLFLLLGWRVDDSILDGYGPLSRQPLWLQALQMLLIADFIDYWTHRWFHVSWAWRFHAIHHSPREMNWIASARMHPVNDFVTRICQVVPIVLMGFSIKAALLVVPFLVFFVIMLHSNLNWNFGPLKWVFVSPLYHRWHHTMDEEGLDKNFAGLFPVWDLLFGTAHFPQTEPQQFGVNHNPPPETLLGQLVYPFLSISRQHPNEHPQPESQQDAETQPSHLEI